MQVLIVEDDIRLANALAQILKEHKVLVDVVHDGQAGLDYALADIYDAVVLDVMLPKMDGFAVVSAMRHAQNTTPVLMLTAKDAIPDKVGGLDAGADDYMTKPFAPSELLARLRALTRRKSDLMFEKAAFGDIELDLDSCDLICGNKSIHLGFKEFNVLKILISNSTQVVSKESLIAKVWGVESTADDNNVEAYISFLRKKLGFVGSKVKINTLRKVGYRLEIEG